MATEVDYVSGTASNADGASTACIAAQGASYQTVLTDITLSNSSATAVEVVIKDGSTAKWTFPVPANTSGVVFNWVSGLVGTANTAWNFDQSGTSNAITCSMSGYRKRIPGG